MSRLVLVDGHAILHWAYHAYPQTLKTRKGELTNAVYGFTSILLSVLKELKPKYVACAFDLPVPTFRHKKYKEYKAHRPKVDEELKQQIPKAKGVVRTLNIPIFEKEGFEADDVIGTIAKGASKTVASLSSAARFDPVFQSQAKKLSRSIKSSAPAVNRKTLSNLQPQREAVAKKIDSSVQSPREPELEVIIVTGDKDALQLIDNNIKVFVPGRGKRQAKMFNRKEFIKQYGFEPRQLIDFKALCGDASDNIPGVKGIGPKTATKLIVQFGGVKQIYENLDKIELKVVDKLTKQKKQALLSFKLAKIVTDVKMKLDLKKCRVLDYDKERVIQLFKELEFMSLIGRLPGMKVLGQSDGKRATLRALKKTEGTEKKKEKQMGLF